MQAAFDLDPDATMVAVDSVVQGFQMPGNEVEGFTRRSLAIALAGIYDLRLLNAQLVAASQRPVDAKGLGVD